MQRFGDLVIDSAARLLTLAGQRIELPKREYSLLEILLAGMNRAVSKDEIANKLFAFDDDAAPNAIEVYIARLRRSSKARRCASRPGAAPAILTCSDDGKPPAGGLLEILLAGMNARRRGTRSPKLFAFDDDAAPNAIEVYIARLRLEGSPLRIETRRAPAHPDVQR